MNVGEKSSDWLWTGLILVLFVAVWMANSLARLAGDAEPDPWGRND